MHALDDWSRTQEHTLVAESLMIKCGFSCYHSWTSRSSFPCTTWLGELFCLRRHVCNRKSAWHLVAEAFRFALSHWLRRKTHGIVNIIPDRGGSDRTPHTWRVFGQMIARDQACCEGVRPAQCDSFLRFLTSQGGKKWRRVKWHSEQAFNSSRIKLSLTDGPAVYFSLRFLPPSLDSHWRQQQQCSVHHPSSTFRGYMGLFFFFVVSACWFYFCFPFRVDDVCPNPPSHQVTPVLLPCVGADVSSGSVFFTPFMIFFFNLSYFFHTCSIIATIWTKRALQRCNGKKKGNEYFYIVDTWLNICFFFLTSTLHLLRILILIQ